MPELTYRYAGPADVPPVVALVDSAYRGGESRAGWTSEAELIDGQRTDVATVSALIAEPGAHVLLAEEAGVLQASLIAWYERRGYQRTGETKPFPYGDERVGIPKLDDLEFVTLAKALR
jgi:hypothetical protein